MKRIVIVGLIFLIILSFVSAGYCDDPVKKLGRGASNVLTCFFETWTQISRVNESDGAVAAVTYGVLKGFLMTGLRAVVGVYEVATFPIPLPKEYKPILTDPEFFLEDLGW